MIKITILNEGLNKLAENLSTDITQGQWGTSATEVSVSDTGLYAPITATLIDVDKTYSGNSSQFTHTIPSTTANNITAYEYSIQFNSATQLTRSVGGGLVKTTAYDLVTISTISFTRT